MEFVLLSCQVSSKQNCSNLNKGVSRVSFTANMKRFITSELYFTSALK